MKYETMSPITTETVCLHCHAAVVQGLDVTGYCAYCGHKICFVGDCIGVHDRICKGFHWSREIPPKLDQCVKKPPKANRKHRKPKKQK